MGDKAMDSSVNSRFVDNCCRRIRRPVLPSENGCRQSNWKESYELDHFLCFKRKRHRKESTEYLSFRFGNHQWLLRSFDA